MYYNYSNIILQSNLGTTKKIRKTLDILHDSFPGTNCRFITSVLAILAIILHLKIHANNLKILTSISKPSQYHTKN